MTRFDDPAPNGCQVNDCSLREAIIEANADSIAGGAVATTIQLQAGVYQLTRPIVPNATAQLYDDDTPETGDLDIKADQFHAGSQVVLIGMGAGMTIINANQIDRAIDVGNYINVTVQDLSIRNGRGYYANIPGGESHTHGGAIHNHGILQLNRVTISDSTATYFQPNGGALYNASGATATLTNVTIARNRSLSDGSSTPSGGGIEGAGDLNLNNVTVVNNTAGGVKINGGTTTVRNSILANNGNDCTGALLSMEYSLIESNACTGYQNANLTGQDPDLRPLPTFAGYVFLYVPKVGSPVIDSGDLCPSVDEISVARPQDGNNDTVPVCDMGASEFTRITILVTIEDKNGPIGAPVNPGAGYHSYDIGTQATFTATSNASHVFLGWEIEHQPFGWASPMTMTVGASVEVIARYAPRPSFSDVPGGQSYTEAVHNLAARGLVLGYGGGRFGPSDKVNRGQMAALIARATPQGPGTPPTTLTPPNCLVAASWDCEVWATDFTDQNGLDPNLWRDVAALRHYGVALGYTQADCATKGKAYPCYGPNDQVTYAQTISFITRTMVKKGYWQNQPGGAPPYSGVPTAHADDVRTYHYYTQGFGGVATGPGPWSEARWNDGATRGWFAQALSVALLSYWGSDAPGFGGYVP